MAIVTEAYPHKESPQRGSQKWNSSDNSITSEYTRTYLAKTDTATTDEMVVLQSSYVPQLFDTDPFNSDARVSGRDAERTENPVYWKVDVQYSTKVPTAQDGDNSDSPLNIKPKWSRSSSQISVPIWEDVDGKVIKNTADQQFNPPVNVVRFNAVYRVIRGELKYPNEQYEGRVNSSTFLGKPAGTLLCTIPSIEEAFSHSLKFYWVTYEFHYDYRGWQPRVLSAGLMQKVAGTPVKLKPCVDALGQDVTSPVPLDSNGAQITLDNLATNTGISFVDVKGYKTANFNALGLTLP